MAQRAIPANPFANFPGSRVIQYFGSRVGGLILYPRDDTCPEGFVAPFDPLPGVCALPGGPTTAFFARADDAGSITVTRGGDYRALGNRLVVDWQGFEKTSGRGDQPVLVFHGPPTRYFPYYTDFAFGRRTDITAGIYESFFYDQQGYVVVQGPGGKIRGVAKRNVGTPDEAYVVITGFIVSETGVLEVHTRKNTEQMWTKIGEVGPIPDIGNPVVTSTSRPWHVPFHFNAAGTKAVGLRFQDEFLVGPTIEPEKFYRIDIEVGAADVSWTHTKVVGSRTSTFVTRRTEENAEETESPDPEQLPRCGVGSGSYTYTRMSSGSAEKSEDSVYGAVPIAYDFKWPTDELGTITWAERHQNLVTSSYTTAVNITYSEACWDDTQQKLVTNITTRSGSAVTVETATDDRQNEVTLAIDGGQYSDSITFELGQFADSDWSADSVRRNTTTYTGAAESFSQSIDSFNSAQEMKRYNDSIVWSLYFEFMFADIRIGGMSFAHRQRVYQGPARNLSEYNYPADPNTALVVPGNQQSPVPVEDKRNPPPGERPWTGTGVVEPASQSGPGFAPWIMWAQDGFIFRTTHQVTGPGVSEFYTQDETVSWADGYLTSTPQSPVQGEWEQFATLSQALPALDLDDIDVGENDTTVVMDEDYGTLLHGAGHRMPISSVAAGNCMGRFDRHGDLMWSFGVIGSDNCRWANTINFFYQAEFVKFYKEGYTAGDTSALIGMTGANQRIDDVVLV